MLPMYLRLSTFEQLKIIDSTSMFCTFLAKQCYGFFLLEGMISYSLQNVLQTPYGFSLRGKQCYSVVFPLIEALKDGCCEDSFGQDEMFNVTYNIFSHGMET